MGVLARELAELGCQALFIDQVPHIGGNAYGELDVRGTLVQRYGLHIYSTPMASAFPCSRDWGSARSWFDECACWDLRQPGRFQCFLVDCDLVVPLA